MQAYCIAVIKLGLFTPPPTSCPKSHTAQTNKSSGHLGKDDRFWRSRVELGGIVAGGQPGFPQACVPEHLSQPLSSASHHAASCLGTVSTVEAPGHDASPPQPHLVLGCGLQALLLGLAGASGLCQRWPRNLGAPLVHVAHSGLWSGGMLAVQGACLLHPGQPELSVQPSPAAVMSHTSPTGLQTWQFPCPAIPKPSPSSLHSSSPASSTHPSRVWQCWGVLDETVRSRASSALHKRCSFREAFLRLTCNDM